MELVSEVDSRVVIGEASSELVSWLEGKSEGELGRINFLTIVVVLGEV